MSFVYVGCNTPTWSKFVITAFDSKIWKYVYMLLLNIVIQCIPVSTCKICMSLTWTLKHHLSKSSKEKPSSLYTLLQKKENISTFDKTKWYSIFIYLSMIICDSDRILCVSYAWKKVLLSYKTFTWKLCTGTLKWHTEERSLRQQSCASPVHCTSHKWFDTISP